MKIHGLKRAVGLSRGLTGDRYLNIYVNVKSGEMWCDEFVGARGSHVQYNEKNILMVCCVDRPVTMAELQRRVDWKIAHSDDMWQYYEMFPDERE